VKPATLPSENETLYPWGHSRRFNSYAEYLKKQPTGRIQKVAIDAGFSCPNRDGTLSYGGCSFCSNEAFNPSYCNPAKSITQQINEGIEFHTRRYRRAKQYFAYFQPFSNTHKPLAELKTLYTEALEHPLVAGLVIGTRPDCVDDEKLDYLQDIAQTHHVFIEYGIESCYDKTLQAINRGHSFSQSVEAINQTTKRGITCGAHIVFGLPGESREEMLAQSEILSALPLTTLKFHQLQIFRNTTMAVDFLQQPNTFNLFKLDEYIDFFIDFIERLSPGIMIERFTSEAPPRYLVTEPWSRLRTYQILDMLEKRLKERNTWQGRLFREIKSVN
jgi:uncharacterized protein